MKNLLLSPNSLKEEPPQNSIRPIQLKDFIGQETTKTNLTIFIHSALKRQVCLDHLLLVGPPGLGKTTLARIIAEEVRANFRSTSGPAFEKQGDLAALLTNLEPNQVLFIDEIHRIRKPLEEMLYSTMEDFQLDINIGDGPSARMLKLNLPKFTLVGATTKLALLSAPLRDRFGILLRLEYYTEVELQQILKRSASIWQIRVDALALAEISRRSRGTPRIANRLLKRCQDFAAAGDENSLNVKTTQTALKSLGIDGLGLDALDRQILKLLSQQHPRALGLSTLAAAIGEEPATLEEVVEPYLLQLLLLQRTPKGRMLTQKGLKVALGKTLL